MSLLFTMLRRSRRRIVLSSLFSKETTLGIDIGSNCIKAVEIVPGAKGWSLANAAVAPCPKDAVKDGVVLNVGEVSCPIDRIGEEQPDNRTWKAVQPLFEELIREIKRSINYYHSQFPEGSEEQFVSHIILTGGTARMPGMDAYMLSKLSIRTETADVFAQSAIATHQVAPDFVTAHGPVLAVCAGLALKELVGETRTKAA
jgi:Tfp pilus assembly PilM family ATPase